MGFMKPISDDIWIIDGEEVSWYGMPYTTRTTVVKLKTGELWIHSPGKTSEELLKEIEGHGPVGYLVSPNKIHHLFLTEWKNKYPAASLYASPGLREKRRDVEFDKDLGDFPEKEWSDEVDQIIFKGSSAMEEIVFFHKNSKTLILTDLIENFHPDHFSGYKKVIARVTGIVSPKGKTPLDWRMTFMLGKKEARSCLEKMISWHPSNIIISHGECIFEGAEEFLKKSFRWLGRA